MDHPLDWLADHVRLIAYAVRRWGPGDLDDAWGVAALGLVKAARTYDPARGAWSTYAVRCMQNELGMAWRVRGWREAREYLWWDQPVPGLDEGAESWGTIWPDPHDPLAQWDDALPLYDWAAVAAAVAQAPRRVQALWMDCVRYPDATNRERGARLGWPPPVVSKVRRRLQAVVVAVLQDQQRQWSA